MNVLPNFHRYIFACPVVELSGYAAHKRLPGKLYAYLDFGGFTGTAKDGLAEGMLSIAVQSGKLKPGQPVLEADSGSFAQALCISAGRSGHPVTLIVPPTLDRDRQQLLRDLGAELVYSMDVQLGRREEARQFAARTAEKLGAYFLDRFYNDDNPEYHRRITGPSILRATDNGNGIDTIVAGVGTGGTITGVGEHIKAWTNHIRMVAVEPYESQALAGGFTGRHSIPGIGAGFIPDNYNPYIVDLLMAVTGGEAQRTALEVLKSDGVPACTSAGAVLSAARELLEKGRAKSVLCIFSGRSFPANDTLL